MAAHKHVALIKAWDDGAEIQCRTTLGNWYNISVPSWDESSEYRIKPEPVYTTYYKRAIIQSSITDEYCVLTVGQPGWTYAEHGQYGKFVRWIDTEPQRELVSE